MSYMNLLETTCLQPAMRCRSTYRTFFTIRHDLSTIDGVILYKDRRVIPPSLRDEVLSAVHAAHQGVSSMTSRAEKSVFWPGITQAINYTRLSCNHCNRAAPSNPSAPPVPPTTPEYPFQCVFVCVRTILPTRATTTLSLSTDIPFGLLWKGQGMVQRGSSPASETYMYFLHLESRMNLLQMEDQNSQRQTHGYSSRTGVSTIDSHL